VTFAIIWCLAVAFAVVIFVLPFTSVASYVVAYEVTALTAYSLQLAIYMLAVCKCLLPAMKKLDEMTSERSSVVKQFVVMVVCISGRFIIQMLYLAADHDKVDG